MTGVGAMLDPVVLGAWLHDLDPYVFRISGDFGPRWYAVSYLLSFVLGWWLLRWLAGRGVCLVPRANLIDAAITIVVGIMVGGRIGYVLAYEPALLTEFTSTPPWWGLLAIHRGGMASHGGMVGVIVACWFVSRGFRQEDGTRKGRCPWTHVLDMLAMVAPVGLCLGRLANFINGELLGRVVAAPGEAAPWWAVRYPQEYVERTHTELTATRTEAVYWRAVELGQSNLLPTDDLSKVDWRTGIARVIGRLQDGSAEAAAKLEPLVSARHPSQLYQALAEGVVLFGVLWFVARKPRLPGVIGCWFLMTYGVGRIATEFVRLPDAGLGRIGPFSRGQWLSVVMVLVGAAILFIIRARGGEKLGGWAAKRPEGEPTSDAEAPDAESEA